MPGALQQACFINVWRISRMDLIMFLAISGAALLGVGWKRGLSSLRFTTVTSTVGIYCVGCFRRCYHFVELLSNLYLLKHLIRIPVCLELETPTLEICLIGPAVRLVPAYYAQFDLIIWYLEKTIPTF